MLRSDLLGVEVRRLPRLPLSGVALRPRLRGGRRRQHGVPPPSQADRMDRGRARVLGLATAPRRQLRRSVPVRTLAGRHCLHHLLRQRGVGLPRRPDLRPGEKPDPRRDRPGRRMALRERRDPWAPVEPPRRRRRGPRPRRGSDRDHAVSRSESLLFGPNPRAAVARGVVRRVRRRRSGVPDPWYVLPRPPERAHRRAASPAVAPGSGPIPRPVRPSGWESRRRMLQPEHANILPGRLRTPGIPRPQLGLDRAAAQHLGRGGDWLSDCGPSTPTTITPA